MNQRSPAEVAERVRDRMLADDRVPRLLGIAVTTIGPGHGTTTMTVRDDMLNGLGTCHGGLVATLADTAFAYACNAYDELTVASGFSIELLAPSHAGDVLTAVAVEVAKGGRTGLYDITVTNQRDQRIALFRGRSYTAKGKRVTSDEG